MEQSNSNGNNNQNEELNANDIKAFQDYYENLNSANPNEVKENHSEIANNEENRNNIKEKEVKPLINSEYYNEGNIPKYNDIVDYENHLKAEIELTTPLISEDKEIQSLIIEYNGSIFENSIKEIGKNYKRIRYARRDGNCFYRSYIYRIFEHCALNGDKKTFDEIIKKLENSKEVIVNNGFDWDICEDFYKMLVSEFKFIMQLQHNDKKPYLNMIFADKEKGNYMIAFIRIFISAYIKENRFLYENFIFDEDLDTWCRREVEPIDVECDNLQIIAVTNCFNIGVIIENLNEKKIERMQFPEEGCENYLVNLFFRPGHYDILYK